VKLFRVIIEGGDNGTAVRINGQWWFWIL